MFWPNWNVKKCTAQVDLAEVGGSVDTIGELPEHWKLVRIQHSFCIKIPKIRTRPDPAPRLGCQVEGTNPVCVCPWRYSFYDSIFLHLVPDPFALGRFGLIGNEWSPLGPAGRTPWGHIYAVVHAMDRWFLAEGEF